VASGLVLYDHPPSSNGFKVRMLLDILGLDYEMRLVPFDRPRPRWYTAWHPFGGIPAIEDGDFRLGESNTILRYLAQREPRYDLYPQELQSRARVDYALDAWSTRIRPGVLPFEMESRSADPDAAKLEASAPAAKQVYDEWEAFVADNGTVVGDFTIADCSVASGLLRTKAFGWEDEFPRRWPKLLRLREAIEAHPAYQRQAAVPDVP
jgi:glutathione S-transferase